MGYGDRVVRDRAFADMASGDRRTEYVAVSNTVTGVLLLIAGTESGILAQLDTAVALAFLAGLGVIGVFVGQSLSDVRRIEVA